MSAKGRAGGPTIPFLAASLFHRLGHLHDLCIEPREIGFHRSSKRGAQTLQFFRNCLEGVAYDIASESMRNVNPKSP